jgi:hypothetical protein
MSENPKQSRENRKYQFMIYCKLSAFQSNSPEEIGPRRQRQLNKRFLGEEFVVPHRRELLSLRRANNYGRHSVAGFRAAAISPAKRGPKLMYGGTKRKAPGVERTTIKSPVKKRSPNKKSEGTINHQHKLQ